MVHWWPHGGGCGMLHARVVVVGVVVGLVGGGVLVGWLVGCWCWIVIVVGTITVAVAGWFVLVESCWCMLYHVV